MQFLACSEVTVLVREDDFHAPVQLTAGGTVIAGNRKALAIAAGVDAITADPRFE
jgi:hypothetical protein